MNYWLESLCWKDKEWQGILSGWLVPTVSRLLRLSCCFILYDVAVFPVGSMPTYHFIHLNLICGIKVVSWCRMRLISKKTANRFLR